MRNKFVVLLACLLSLILSSEKSSAQYYFYNDGYYDSKVTFEFGASLGAMNCLTDVGGKAGVGGKFVKDLSIGNTHFQGGAYFTMTYNYAIALRAEYTRGLVSAYDSIQKPYAASTSGRYERNLSFKSAISEFAVIAEFHPLFMFINWPSKDVEPPRLSPYFMIGIGHYHFNPQTDLNGQTYDLHDYHTEGEGWIAGRPQYKLDQYNMPIGLGLRYEAGQGIYLRLEVLDRLLFTDYLDDVSTRYINNQYFITHLSGQDALIAQQLADRNIYNPLTSPPGTNASHGSPDNSTQGSIRGNPHNNDNYFSINFKIGIVLGRDKIE